jgi:hypothetical protein
LYLIIFFLSSDFRVSILWLCFLVQIHIEYRFLKVLEGTTESVPRRHP